MLQLWTRLKARHERGHQKLIAQQEAQGRRAVWPMVGLWWLSAVGLSAFLYVAMRKAVLTPQADFLALSFEQQATVYLIIGGLGGAYVMLLVFLGLMALSEAKLRKDYADKYRQQDLTDAMPALDA